MTNVFFCGYAVRVTGTLVFMPPEYRQRILSVGEVFEIARGELPTDSAIRGRLSEVTAAAQMFADYPIIGIGYGNFERLYQRYSYDIGLDGRREARQASTPPPAPRTSRSEGVV